MTRPDPLEATVAGHTARHLTATTYCQPGRSNTDAAQLIESLHTRPSAASNNRCLCPPAQSPQHGPPGEKSHEPEQPPLEAAPDQPSTDTCAWQRGRCASTAPVRDQSTGATGTFVASIVDPPRSGGADYSLVDFGPRTVALTVISGRAAARNHTRPRPGQTVCRSGITTGEQCGSIAAAYGDHQYLTTGMPPSRGGDSGAPVWAVGDDGRVQVLGIWLGGRTTADGHDYGRFAALTCAVSALGITSAD